MEWERIFANDTSDWELISKIYKVPQQFLDKWEKTSNLILKWGKGGWIQAWYIVRTFIDATVYPYPAQQ
jgi:hypothetical protein